MEEAVTTEDRYARFMRANGTPYAYVVLDADDYLDEVVPVEAKWATVQIGVNAEDGEPLMLQRTISHFAPHATYLPATDEYLVLLCACERPSIRQRPVTYADLVEWEAYLAVVLTVPFEDWLTRDEASHLLPDEA